MGHASSTDPLTEPTIVVGSPRSGTSFIGTLLRGSSSVAYVIEPRLVWKLGNDNRSDLLKVEDARPEVIRQIRENFRRSAADGGKSQIVEKTPSNSLRMPFIEKVFPDCRFVHVIRNPVDAVISIREHWQQYAHGLKNLRPGLWQQRWKSLTLARSPHYAAEFIRRILPPAFSPVVGPAIWGPRLPGLAQIVAEQGLLEACCYQWRMCVEAACHHGSRLAFDRYYEFRLEDFSLSVLNDILEFCHIKSRDEVIARYHQHYDTTRAASRHPTADPEDVKTILRLTEPTMVWLGYDRARFTPAMVPVNTPRSAPPSSQDAFPNHRDEHPALISTGSESQNA